MTFANSKTARVADRHGETGDDWSDLVFGDDTAEPVVEQRRSILPVITQIPDVSDLIPLPPKGALRAPVDRGPVRVDPPAARAPVGRHNEADRARLCDVALTLAPPKAETSSHIRPLPKKLNVSPSAETFKLPSEPLYEKFAPLVRFILLFVLFTAAGTSVLMIARGPSEMPPEKTRKRLVLIEEAVAVPTAKSTAAARPTLESLMMPEPAPPAVVPEKRETAPAIARTDAKLTQSDTKLVPLSDPQVAPAIVEEPRPRTNLRTPSEEPKSRPYPSTNTTTYPTSKLPTAADGQFPQVRTTDAPGAIARQPGAYQQISPR